MKNIEEVYVYIRDNIHKLSIEEIENNVVHHLDRKVFYWSWVLYQKRHKNDNNNNNELSKIDFELKEKRRDHRYKEKIKHNYEYKCCVTGVPVEECEIAHIIPFSRCLEEDKYNSYNGIIFSANIHKCFDKYYFSINNKKEVIVHPNILTKNYSITKYNGYIIKNIPEQSLKYIQQHYDIFAQTLN